MVGFLTDFSAVLSFEFLTTSDMCFALKDNLWTKLGACSGKAVHGRRACS